MQWFLDTPGRSAASAIGVRDVGPRWFPGQYTEGPGDDRRVIAANVTLTEDIAPDAAARVGHDGCSNSGDYDRAPTKSSPSYDD
jgi:hypothetical protein